jgi:hypothetical protein
LLKGVASFCEFILVDDDPVPALVVANVINLRFEKLLHQSLALHCSVVIARDHGFDLFPTQLAQHPAGKLGIWAWPTFGKRPDRVARLSIADHLRIGLTFSGNALEIKRRNSLVVGFRDRGV